MTVLTFISLVLLLFPMSLSTYNGTQGELLLGLLQSVQNALRTFVLDGCWSDWFAGITGGVRVLPYWYSVFGIVLSIVAPVLTFDYILSLFGDFRARRKVLLAKLIGRPIIIMSELNEEAIVICESVIAAKDKKKPLIVFAEVFANRAEENDLRQRALQTGALMLKKDVRYILKPTCVNGEIEFYLLGKDENENLEQAVFLSSQYKGSGSVCIYVFARREYAEKILNTIDKGPALNPGTEKNERSADELIANRCLKVRRIDTPALMALSVVQEIKPFTKFREENGKKIISILIAGGGQYGEALLKTLVWYCQMIGYFLEINMIDKYKKSEICYNGVPLEPRLNRKCPELLKMNDVSKDGEAYYSIRFYESIDLETDDLDKIMFADSGDTSECRNRLLRTTAVVVSLGKDDVNLDAAMYLRTLFKRVANKNGSDFRPNIYPIVYGFENDICDVIANIVTWTGEQMDIQPVGSMKTVFCIDRIRSRELEKTGYSYHTVWTRIEEQKQREEKGEVQEDICRKYADLRLSYEKDDYFRLSSVARAVHADAVRGMPEIQCHLYGEGNPKRLTCKCQGCKKRGKVEHMRWNAYMRTIGFSYGSTKDAVAKTHVDLVGTNEIKSASEIMKDMS